MAKGSDNVFNDILRDMKGLEIDLHEATGEAMRFTAKESVKEMVKNSPVVTGDLRKGYTVGEMTATKGKRSVDIHNNTSYALYEEEGHRQVKRWIPGRWQGNKFTYDPTEKKSGMMLKRKWVKGSFRMRTTLSKYSKVVLPKALDNRIGAVMSKWGWK
jgi:hypothetical protein